MSLLILMRHGQSVWNAANLFTGWVNVPLTPKGIDEAIGGGRTIAHLGIDEVHTSTLIRAQMTAMLALSEHTGGKTPVVKSPQMRETQFDGESSPRLVDWTTVHGPQNDILPVYVAQELNERMYGDLQGLNKQDTREKYGDEQVKVWRRSYDVPPPHGESLEMTAHRTLPYFNQAILPSLKGGKNVFVAAHGNSLRSIIMDIEGLNRDEVLSLEVPTGTPLVYAWSQQGWQRLNEF
ncbi:MAG: phosphoglycerate mutase [Euryarchaeota archaeon]|nr:phosphoglycerate mutase [Euryarchaeota archaeon]|tara:strand:+ start:21136 stop:21843 length:708 start_codon:yes stop_codon:yes gene_type:complete